MENTFELGPLQEFWVETLRKYPERQYKGRLGMIEGSKISACCLGQYLLCEAEFNNKELISGDIKDGTSTMCLTKSYERLGLNSDNGNIAGTTDTLANMNDCESTWPEIADFIKSNPEKVFTKSV